MALALYTAQRRGDVVRMGRQHIRGDMIAVRQHKTGTFLEIPIHPDLAQILETAPKDNMTLLLSDAGPPYRPTSFGNWFGDRCREADLPTGYNAHGLRKAGARRLAEAGCTTSKSCRSPGTRQYPRSNDIPARPARRRWRWSVWRRSDVLTEQSEMF